jgi:hypothetical protein
LGETGSVAGFDIISLGGGAPDRIDGVYSPFLGQKHRAEVLEVARSVAPDAPFGWSLLRSGSRVTRLELDHLEVSSDGGSVLPVPLEWS